MSQRGGRINRRRMTAVILVILAAVIVASAVLAARFIPSGGGGSFPVKVSGMAVQQMEMVGGSVAVAEDASLRMYDSSGNERYMLELNYSSPVLVPSGNRVLIYERGGTRMKICGRSGEICSKEIQEQILTGGFGDGKAAVATLSNSTTSRLTVYDTNLINEIFVWQTSSYISRVAVSPNGRYVAVAVVNNAGGDYYSEVSVFDTKATDALFTNRYDGEMVLNLRFDGNSDIIVVTDRSISAISGRDTLAWQEQFEYGAVSGISDAGGGDTALILTKISDGKDYLYVYGNDGKVHMEVQIDSGSLALSASSSSAFVLYEDQLLRYPLSGSKASPEQVNTQSNSLKILADGNHVYVLTPEEIQKF